MPVAILNRRSFGGVPSTTLGISGNQFTLNGSVNPLYGIRAASASISQTYTDRLIAALPDYYAHGARAVNVYLQGSRGANDADTGIAAVFTQGANDSVTINAGHLDRLKQIITAANSQGMVVIAGVFYQAGRANLTSLEAVRNALRAVADELVTYTNVAINVCNEQNSSGYSDFTTASGWNWNDTARVIEACQVVKARQPSIIVGGGGYNSTPSGGNNATIVAGTGVDALFYDSDSFADNDATQVAAFRSNGANKPMMNVELFGGVTKASNDGGSLSTIAGEYTTTEKDYYTTAVANCKSVGVGAHFHDSRWTQDSPPSAQAAGSKDGIRYHLGSAEGSAANPGIRWWFEYVRDNG